MQCLKQLPVTNIICYTFSLLCSFLSSFQADFSLLFDFVCSIVGPPVMCIPSKQARRLLRPTSPVSIVELQRRRSIQRRRAPNIDYLNQRLLQTKLTPSCANKLASTSVSTSVSAAPKLARSWRSVGVTAAKSERVEERVEERVSHTIIGAVVVSGGGGGCFVVVVVVGGGGGCCWWWLLLVVVLVVVVVLVAVVVGGVL